MNLVNQALRSHAGAAWEAMTVEGILSHTAPFVIPESSTTLASAPVLLLSVPSRAALRQQPVLADTQGRFMATLKAVSGKDALGAARGLGTLWYQCLRMVLNNKCSAVC